MTVSKRERSELDARLTALREENARLKVDVAGLARNNVSLVSEIHELEQKLREAKRLAQ